MAMFKDMRQIWGVDEYQEDFIIILQEREAKLPQFTLQSPQITCRPFLVELLKDIAIKKKLDQLTIHLSVYILDIVMQGHDIEANRLELVALVTLMLASKFQERETKTLSAKEANGLVKHKYVLKDFYSMECLILKYMNWNINIPTVVDFVHAYMEFLFSHDELTKFALLQPLEQFWTDIQSIILLYMDCVMTDVNIMHQKPSKVAAAIMACTRINLKMSIIYPPQILVISKYRLFELKGLITNLKAGVQEVIEL